MQPAPNERLPPGQLRPELRRLTQRHPALHGKRDATEIEGGQGALPAEPVAANVTEEVSVCVCHHRGAGGRRPRASVVHLWRVAALVTAQSSSPALARALQPAPTHPAAGADTHIPRAPEWRYGRERLRVCDATQYRGCDCDSWWIAKPSRRNLAAADGRGRTLRVCARTRTAGCLVA